MENEENAKKEKLRIILLQFLLKDIAMKVYAYKKSISLSKKRNLR
jgi:hypothetical protein